MKERNGVRERRGKSCSKTHLDVVEEVIQGSRDVRGRLAELSERRFVTADVAASRDAALDGLGDFPGSLHQLLLAERVADGRRHDFGASDELAGGQSALSGGSDDLRRKQNI